MNHRLRSFLTFLVCAVVYVLGSTYATVEPEILTPFRWGMICFALGAWFAMFTVPIMDGEK